jgi:hypothetical protein
VDRAAGRQNNHAEEQLMSNVPPIQGFSWLRPHRGQGEAPTFFHTIGGAFEFHHFHPRTFLESGNAVVGLTEVDRRPKATGQRIRKGDEVHFWRFEDTGRITRSAHTLDTHRHLMSCGSPAV